MKKLARTIRFDESDDNVFARTAEVGEWAISGGFEFSNWVEDDLVGKARQAFANGWLGLDTFGRSTFVAVAPVTDQELDAIAHKLAKYFVEILGAPDMDTALGVAKGELGQMSDMCDDHDSNTLMIVERDLVDAGVRERFRVIQPQDAELEAFAVHGAVD